MNTFNFDNWLAKLFADEGLADIKFAVLPGKGVSVEAIKEELLAAESLIKSNYLKQPPQPTSMIPTNVEKIIHNVAA